MLVSVWIEGITETGARSIPFVVDTGAALTVIHALDAVRQLGMSPAALNPRAWPRHERVRAGGVGGEMEMWRRPAFLGFQHDDGHWSELTTEIGIGERSTAGLPSILGLDVLAHFRLVVDGRGSVTLELR